MFPFCSCVCQNNTNWIIICNNISQFSPSCELKISLTNSETTEISTQIQFLFHGNNEIDASIPDINAISLSQPSENVDISYSSSYMTSLSQISNNFNYSKNCTDFNYHLSKNDSQLIEQACVTCDRTRLVKIQKNRKYNRRRQSINYFQRIRISSFDKYGLVDLANYNFSQEYLSKYLDAWNFNVFRMNRFTGGNLTLMTIGLQIFANQSLIQHFSLDTENLKQFLHSVEEVYHCFNPYHNALHSADVAQAMHCFLLDSKIKVISEPIDVLSGIIAAFCHDADHPGLNQIHLEKINHFLVKLYNHSSILENHHFRVTMSLLQQTPLLKHLSQENWKSLSTNIFNMIMATDITHQKNYLNKFMNFLHDKNLNSFGSYVYTKEDKTLVYQLALKCADISNPSRIWPVTLGWASLVCEEFFIQGDMEKTQGFPVMSTHDRCMTTKVDIQLGFIRFIVRPLLTQWNFFLKSVLSNLLIKYVDINLNKWEIYKQRYSAVSTKIIHNPLTKVDLNAIPGSMANSVVPLSGLATLTEETTLVSSCASKPCSNIYRRLSLPDNVLNSFNKSQQTKRLSTTMITFARPAVSSQVPSCRRGSLPQQVKTNSIFNPSRRRGSLPIIVKAFPIPTAWEESFSIINSNKCSPAPRTSQNPMVCNQRRRGSAPLIGYPRTNQDWKGNGLSNMSSCLKEQLLLEVYWMNASSSVSSVNSVNVGSSNNIPPLYLSSSSGSSRNDSASGTVTMIR